MIQHVNVGVLSSSNKIKKLIKFGNTAATGNNKFQFQFEDDYEIIQSSHSIYKDNTISYIKYKVLQELKNTSYEELYFFIENTNQKLKWSSLFDGSDIEPTKEMFAQLLENVPSIRGKIDPNIATYDDFVKISPYNETILRPLGFHIEGNELLFSVNPFSNIFSTEKTKLIMFDHELLLNYLPNQTGDGDGQQINIYLCLAEDFFQREGYSRAISTYYQLLYNKSIITEEQLYDRRGELTQIKTIVDPIDNFYRINEQKEVTPLPPYSEVGIRSFHIKLHPENKFLLPLDAIFKILQTSVQMPFVKYNPGSRRENVYRLYSEKIAKNGKKIPYMNKNEINNLMRKIGKSRQVAVYATRQHFQELDIHHKIYLYCIFESNGDISIYSDNFENAIPIEKMEMIIRELTTPILNTIHEYLGSSGYIINPFQTFNNTSGLEIVNIKYIWSLLYDKPGNIKKQIETYSGCYSTLFERLLKLDDLKRGVNLKYRRVENYQEMEGEKELISQLFREYGETRAVVNELINVYNKTDTEAAKMIARFIDSVAAFKDRAGKIKVIENPGFSTTIKIEQFELGGINKPNLVIEIDDITSFSYIELLNIYIPAFIRLFIYPKTLNTTFLRELSKKCASGSGNFITAAEEAAVAAAAAAAAETELDEGLIKNIYENTPEEDEEEVAAQIIADAAEHDIPPTQPKIDIQNIIDFMGEDEEWEEEDDDENWGKGGGSEESPAAAAAPQLLDGTSLHPSPFLNKMNKIDPILFTIPNEQKDKFVNYSRTCPVFRQPVILTDNEKRQIDIDHPGVYDKAIRYGSTPNTQNWYICPRYWCLLTNSAISEEDVRAGKCGNVISRKAKKIPKGSYVYEFTDDGKEHIDPSTGNYIKHYPGLTKTKHPRNLRYPCCFKKWDPLLEKYTKQIQESHAHEHAQSQSPTNIDKEDNIESIPSSSPSPVIKKQKRKVHDNEITALEYIFAPEKVFIAVKRWGFLPVVIQRFLQTNNSLCVTINEPNKLKTEARCILRYGVEQNSFLGCIADLYGYNKGIPTPSLDEMRAILIRAISLENFIKFHSGELVKSFFIKYLTEEEFQKAVKKYEASTLIKTFSRERNYMNMVLSALEHFTYFLKNAAIEDIDYTYLWDIVCSRDTILFEKGLNLAILELPEIDNTSNVELICPTNVYSSIPIYDNTKQTAIIIKNGRTYTPVYSVSYGSPPQKLFYKEGGPENIHKLLEFIEYSTNRNCMPLPTRIQFKRAIPIETIIARISNLYTIIKKVYNHYENVIGLIIQETTTKKKCFIPCSPFQNYRTILPEIPSVYINNMDSGAAQPAEDLWVDYENTVEFLRNFSKNTGLSTRPIVKIIDGGYIVGILTETNQFIQINTPEQDLQQDDGLRAIQNSNFITAERDIIENGQKEDDERKRMIKYISLETNFYNTFRILVRTVLNKYENIAYRQQISKIIDSAYKGTYKSKLREIENIIINITKSYVEFIDYNPDVLMEIETISGCSKGSSKKYCMAVNTSITDAPPKFLIPRKNLIHSEIDNKSIYYGRITDELLRHNRIRSFMFKTKLHLNLSEIKYNLKENEVILLQSAFTTGNYFDNLIPEKYIIPFQRAVPPATLSQKYKNIVDYNYTADSSPPLAADEYYKNCIKEIKDNPIGNNRALWVKRLPSHCKEIIFQNNSPNCSFAILQYIIKIVTSNNYSIFDIKQKLLQYYKDLFDKKYGPAIYQVFKKEGKPFIQENFEYYLMSENYYITNFDLWLYFSRSNIPFSVILFSALKLKEISDTFNEDIDWLILSGSSDNVQMQIRKNYIFIRSPTTITRGKPPSYNLITPIVKKGEIRMVDFQNSLNYPQRENSIEIDKYLDIILKTAKEAPKKRIILKSKKTEAKV